MVRRPADGTSPDPLLVAACGADPAATSDGDASAPPVPTTLTFTNVGGSGAGGVYLDLSRAFAPSVSELQFGGDLPDTTITDPVDVTDRVHLIAVDGAPSGYRVVPSDRITSPVAQRLSLSPDLDIAAAPSVSTVGPSPTASSTAPASPPRYDGAGPGHHRLSGVDRRGARWRSGAAHARPDGPGGLARALAARSGHDASQLGAQRHGGTQGVRARRAPDRSSGRPAPCLSRRRPVAGASIRGPFTPSAPGPT